MKKKYATKLESIIALSANTLDVVYDYSKKKITNKSKDPIGSILKLHTIYFHLSKAIEAYQLMVDGECDPTLEILSPVNYYKNLPASVKKTTVSKLPPMD